MARKKEEKTKQKGGKMENEIRSLPFCPSPTDICKYLNDRDGIYPPI
jgi:hypothetical protein